jgi:predicted ribosome quality control (RQC) complex YloA/Tae2 family protein
MKIETVFVKGLNRNITFYIGKNQKDNNIVIENSSINDLWFHANEISSCHIIANIPSDITKKELHYIIKVGALMCKNNTNKLKKLKNVEIIYTQVKNITHTSIPGCVNVINEKIIII